MHGMVEVMRGCGRGCKFCDVTLRPLRYYPVEKVQKEIEINMNYGGLRADGFRVMTFSYTALIDEQQKIWSLTARRLRNYLEGLWPQVLNTLTQHMEL